jgi:PAS domain-containing protein
MTGQLKTRVRHRYQTGWLGDAAGKVQQMSEAQFHGLLEENPDTIIIVDQTGCINFASNRIEAMFGYLPDELLGESLRVLIPVRHRDHHAGHMSRFMQDPRPRMMGAGIRHLLANIAYDPVFGRVHGITRPEM